MSSIRSIIVALLLIFVAACTKKSNNTDNVFIRVENASAENFSNITLNGTAFGAITAGGTSNYLHFKSVYPYPFANLITINDSTLYISDIVPTPYLDNGNYRMKVASDTTYRFQAEFIKE